MNRQQAIDTLQQRFPMFNFNAQIYEEMVDVVIETLGLKRQVMNDGISIFEFYSTPLVNITEWVW